MVKSHLRFSMELVGIICACYYAKKYWCCMETVGRQPMCLLLREKTYVLVWN